MRLPMTLALLATLGLTACTGDDPVDTDVGSASTAITDNAHATAPVKTADGAQSRVLLHGEFTGMLSGSAQVAISADGDTWVDIGSPEPVMVTLQSHQEETAIHSRVPVPVGTYSRVRLTVSGGEAEIYAGAVLGGVTLTSAVAITVGGSDGEVVIEKEVEPFTIGPSTHARVAFDLNTEGWVTEENAGDETAEDAEILSSARAGLIVEEEG